MYLESENEFGNIEYKWKLFFKNDDYYQKKITQLQYRMEEGDGEMFYYLGIKDNGYIQGINYDELQSSLENLQILTNYLNYKIVQTEIFSTDKGTWWSKTMIQKN